MAKDGKIFLNYPTANAWGNSFLHNLHQRLAQQAPHTAHDWVAHIRSNAQTSFAHTMGHSRPASAHGGASMDSQVATVIGACSLLLHSYRLLERHLPAQQALALVQHCFDQTYHAFIAHVCKPLYQQPGFLPQNLRKLSFAQWSQGLMAQRLGGQHLEGYAYFFQNHGAPELTRIVLLADQAWLHTVNTLCDRAGSHAQADYGSFHTSNASSTTAGNAASRFTPFEFAPKAQPIRPHAAADQVFELVRPARRSTYGHSAYGGTFHNA